MYLREEDHGIFFGKIYVEIIIAPTPPVVYQAFWAVSGILRHIGSAEPWYLFRGPKIIYFY